VRHLTRVVAAGTALLASACQFNEVVVPETETTPVVHAVLNPGATDQVILLERLRTGGVDVTDRRYSRVDPITTGGGIPISGAEVLVYREPGDVFVRALEDAATRGDGRGLGVYRFQNAGAAPVMPDVPVLPIVSGATYRLVIHTPDGLTVTGATTIPAVPFVPSGPTVRRINRDRDTLRLFWDSVPSNPRYLVRVVGPTGEVSLYTHELEAEIAGSLRSVFTETFPLIFVPGFRSRVDVAAIDENYFDYYRSANDPFTGTGLINHLDGGLGFFGSLATLYSYSVPVSADFTQPIEGVYTLEGSLISGFVPGTMTLYVNAQSAGEMQITGVYTSSAGEAGVLGALAGDVIALEFLATNTDFRDVLATFSGHVVEGALVGTARAGSTTQSVTFRK
jgi:Domain of unknown function (DUF4249)